MRARPENLETTDPRGVKATHVAVVVPGIMGSVLYSDASGRRREIWGENFYNNYKRLADESTLLRWNEGQRPAKSSLLENVYITNVPLLNRPIPLAKWRLWGKLLQYLSDHSEFKKDGQTLKYSYDWRQSLLETAKDLGSQLDTHARDLVSHQGLSREDLRYVFFTHSMGGLVVRIALALKVLAPGVVDRIVHIGSPLQGAPAAFRSAFQTGSLPFLREFFDFVRGKKDADLCFEHLLDNIRTFPSIYQVMPPGSSEYLYYTFNDRFNPFARTNGCISKDKCWHAHEAHKRLAEAEEIVRQHGIKIFTIYGSWHKDETDFGYFVEPVGGPNPRYTIIGKPLTRNEGDGTVPKWSAEGSDSCEQKPLRHIDHATLCNNKFVVEVVDDILQN